MTVQPNVTIGVIETPQGVICRIDRGAEVMAIDLNIDDNRECQGSSRDIVHRLKVHIVAAVRNGEGRGIRPACGL